MSISFSGLLKGALTLVGALSFNSCMNNIIQIKYPNSNDRIRANIIYVFIVILLIIIIAYTYNNVCEKFNLEDKKNPTHSTHWINNNYVEHLN